MHSTIVAVTDRIRSRSSPLRGGYLERLEAASSTQPLRGRLSCTNLAHSYAASPALDKIPLRQQRVPNIAIVSAYNDMLSAHQPYATYPEVIRAAARVAGATAQFAGGVLEVVGDRTPAAAAMISCHAADTVGRIARCRDRAGGFLRGLDEREQNRLRAAIEHAL